MKIRTQFIISTAIFGAILLIITASVIITNQRVEQANNQEEIARKLQQEAGELSYLSSAFLLYQESQQISRWESKFASFSNTLMSLNPATPEEQVVVGNIKTNQERLKAVSAEVRATVEDPSRTQSNLLDPALIQVSWSRMEVQNQGMIFEAARLAQIFRYQGDDLKQLNAILMFVLIALLGAFLLSSYVLTHRRTLRSISDLQAGTAIIGSGNLDHAIAVKRNDEIGDLAHAFNRMTASLKGVTASKVELESEIAERKRAEDRANRQKAIQEGINRILEASLACDTEEELGRISLEVAEHLTGSKFGFVGETNARGLLDGIAISDPGWDACRMDNPTGHGRVPTGFTIHGVYGRVLLDGKGFFTNDPASHADSIGAPEGHPLLKSFLGVPLARGGETIGMVGVANREGGYADEDLEALESLAPAIVQAFMRKRVEQDRERLLVEVQRRAAELNAANQELEAFSYSVSHDLRAPLRHMDGFSRVLLHDYADKLDEQGQKYLQYVRGGSQRMGLLIEDILKLSRVSRSEIRRERVNLSKMANEIVEELRAQEPERQVEVTVAPAEAVNGDRRLLRLVLENLTGNAWKFTSKRSIAKIEFGTAKQDGNTVYFVRDNGAGFDMDYVAKLFGAFQRLHTEDEFPGTGIGLATVQRIIHRHGGSVWAEGEIDKGATFYFTLE